MSNKLTLQQVIDKVCKIHGDTLVLDETTYINSSIKARFVDKKYGEWWVIPKSVWIQKQSHPKRRYEKVRNKTRLSLNEVKKRIKNIHGDTVVVDETTYVNTKEKCRFIDKEYGEFWTKLNIMFTHSSGHPKRAQHKREQVFLKKYGVKHVLQNKTIKQKAEQTCIEKYGVKYAMQNKFVALKSAKHSNNSYIIDHWKTNKKLVCQGKYEKKVVEYFNKNKIDFKWQPRVFKIKELKTTYRPDCYLCSENKWVEIKGYFRKDAEEKWNWFHKNYPNSELWDKERLKLLEIL